MRQYDNFYECKPLIFESIKNILKNKVVGVYEDFIPINNPNNVPLVVYSCNDLQFTTRATDGSVACGSFVLSIDLFTTNKDEIEEVGKLLISEYNCAYVENKEWRLAQILFTSQHTEITDNNLYLTTFNFSVTLG